MSLLPVLFPGVANSLPYEVVQLAAFALLAGFLLLATRGRLGWRGPGSSGQRHLDREQATH
jgi:hypothetical protein